jgi:hypothetical protein
MERKDSHWATDVPFGFSSFSAKSSVQMKELRVSSVLFKDDDDIVMFALVFIFVYANIAVRAFII